MRQHRNFVKIKSLTTLLLAWVSRYKYKSISNGEQMPVERLKSNYLREEDSLDLSMLQQVSGNQKGVEIKLCKVSRSQLIKINFKC